MIYILRFDQKLGNPNKKCGQCEYYIGWAENTLKRLNEHRKNRGCCLTRAANAQGIGYTIVALIEGDRNAERWLKNRRNVKRVLKWAQHGKLPYPVYWVDSLALYSPPELTPLELYAMGFERLN